MCDAAALDRLYRETHPEAVARGIPLHVTVLFPFVPLDRFGEDERAQLRRALGSHAPFSFELTRLERWPAVLWLAPEPSEPLRALTASVWAAFPEHPPYEGEFGEPVPHATIAKGAVDDDAADRLHARLAPLLPVPCRADDVVLLAEEAPERWREHERFRLSP